MPKLLHPRHESDEQTKLRVFDTLKEHLDSLEYPTPEQLYRAMKGLNLTRQDVFPFLIPPGYFAYGRRPLYQSSSLEVLVMNWAFNFPCAIHDHGFKTWGWVQVISGEVTNTLYEASKLIPNETTTHLTGDVFFVPSGIIHAMENKGYQPLITVHFYSPPISGMKVYDPPSNRAIIVSDDCGAWYPTEEKQIVAITPLS